MVDIVVARGRCNQERTRSSQFPEDVDSVFEVSDTDDSASCESSDNACPIWEVSDTDDDNGLLAVAEDPLQR
eukprot:7174288-Karenia_brevis.AAC.1